MWLYKDKVIKSIEDFGDVIPYGFIYRTTHIPSGVAYIGKKSIYHNIKKKLSKKELLALPITRGRKVSSVITQKESDWLTYYGSAEPIIKSIKKGEQDLFRREILQLVMSKKLLTYFECKYQFEYGVLEHPDLYYNFNILGKFFTKDFEM